jgi:hypothetical protein
VKVDFTYTFAHRAQEIVELALLKTARAAIPLTDGAIHLF